MLWIFGDQNRAQALGQPIMMFNLKNDPYEMTNLVYLDDFNEKRKELHEKLKRWIEYTGDVFSMPEL